MKVISTSPSFAKYSNHPVEYLKEHGFELQSFPADVALAELKPHLADADALIVAFTEIGAELLDCAPRVRIDARMKTTMSKCAAPLAMVTSL